MGKENMASFLRHANLQKTVLNLRNTTQIQLPSYCQSLSHRKLSCLHHSVRSTQLFGETFLHNRIIERHGTVWCGISSYRWNSTAAKEAAEAGTNTLAAGYIPEPPPIPIPEISQPVVPLDLNALGEPTLSSLGLCNYTPPGLFQYCLENLHVACDLPWWGAIALATLAIRTLMFPLVIKGQRNAANMSNHMPTIQRLQERFSKARMSGNPLEAAKVGGELQDYMSRYKINPIKNLYVPLAQGPIFVSVFIGLRKMANLPVESMTTGGILWFTDLTIPDPFYIMPVLTTFTFLLTLELGVDGARAANMSHAMRWGLRAMPLVMLPFIINFPSAMLCYWFTSNSVSMIQAVVLRTPGMRKRFNIPEMVIHPKNMQPKKKKFFQGFKENWDNSKTLAKVEDRQRMDAMKFKDAGSGPIVKTYAYDPTKGKPNKK